jgi:outer membrane protein OmpA-like peptidoglycan-associated protein
MRKWITVLLWIVALCISPNVQAENDGVTVTGEKGLFTVFTADTVPDGKLSVSGNYNNIDRDPLDVDITYYSATLGYGITDNFEFVAMVTPYVGYDIDPKDPLIGTVNGRVTVTPVGEHGAEYRSGFGDIRLGGKYVFVRGANFGVGVDGFLKIPTASQKEGRGTGKVDVGASFVVSGTVGTSMTIAANAGFAYRGDAKLRNDHGDEIGGADVTIGNAFTWGVGAGFPANSSVQGIAEINGEILEDGSEYDDWTDLTGGLRFRSGNAFYVTLAARWNIQGERDLSEYPYGGLISLAYAPGREIVGEAVPPPPPPTPPAPAPPPPAPAPPAPPSVPEFVWPEVYFPFNQSLLLGDTSLYVITADNRQKLDSVASYMTDHPNVKVTIEGHCCYIGTEEYNLALGQSRAEAIKQYLIGKGIAADRMQTVSYGKAKPKYDNEKEITRRFNRRGYFVAITPQS